VFKRIEEKRGGGRISDVEALRRELDGKGIQPGDVHVQEHEGKRYRVFFAKEPYGVCFCFGQPA
jgi:lactoylglutathione lyase